MSDTESDSKSSKRGAVHRSPSYPAIDLKTAIDRARTFYQHEKRSAASVLVASQHWGYSFSSSGGKQALAALISYGLMEDKGSGDQRHVNLTDLAFRILLDERPESSERDEALRRAALMPKIHAELFGRWPDGLPSNPNLRHYLLIEKKFNENAVDDFIRQLRATADFAKIYSQPASSNSAVAEEGNDSINGGSPGPVPEPSSQFSASPAQPPQLSRVVAGPNVRQDTFSLDEGQVVLQWPAQLSEASYEDLKDWLELQLRKIKRSVQTDTRGE